jgi:ABC-type sugar transport system permease subunit
MSPRDRRQRRFAFVCVTPALILFTLWVGWPTVRAFGYALTRWNGFSEPAFVGLQHFRHLLTDNRLLLLALENNLILMIIPAVLALAISLGFAAALHRGVRGARFFRTVFFFPNILSAIAVSVLWLLMYSTTDYGVLNRILRLLGRTEPYAFTESTVLVWWIIPMLVWGAVGFFMLLFLAAMQNIPESLYDAARIDGASPLRAFTHITFPLIWDTIVVALVFFGMGGLKIFDQVWVFEQQQAIPESNTIATLMYGRIFEEYRIGEGTAIAVIQFVLVLTLTILLLRLWRREALEY